MVLIIKISVSHHKEFSLLFCYVSEHKPVLNFVAFSSVEWLSNAVRQGGVQTLLCLH